MNIPKQKFNFVRSFKFEPHTEEEIDVVINSQDFMDVDTHSVIPFRLNKKQKGYIVQLIGWSYDVETIDYPSGTVFSNHMAFNF